MFYTTLVITNVLFLAIMAALVGPAALQALGAH
jgi:hypothetical protein